MDIKLEPLLCSHKPVVGSTKTVKDMNPDICSEPGDNVKILNKRRERFVIPVTKRVSIKDIEIDSSDSILPFGSPCLSQYKQCCSIKPQDDGTVQVTDLVSGLNCS